MDSGMIVWLICIIPVITTGIFYALKPKEFVWWELILPIVISIGITFLTKLITDDLNVQHDEVWGSTVVEVYESEPYNKWVHKTCTRSRPCGTDSNGNTKYCTEYYDCSYQDNVGPKWYAKTSIGKSPNITEFQYDSIRDLWGNNVQIVKTRRNHSSRSRASSSNGTKFEGTRVGKTSNVNMVKWGLEETTRIPWASRHTYENRIQASDVTVFDLKVVTEEEADSLSLFEYVYPKGNGMNFPTILSQVPISDSVRNKFRKLNAKFGPSNRMRLWVLVYNDAVPTAGVYQENYWVKGNFNELILCISLDKNQNVTWAHSFSWTLTSELPVEARSHIYNIGKFDNAGWNQLYDWLNSNLGRYNKRSHDEFSYIKVTPPAWAIILNVVLTLAVSLGFNFWVTNNSINDNPKPSWQRRRR